MEKQNHTVSLESEQRIDSAENGTFSFDMRKIKQNEMGKIMGVEEKVDWSRQNQSSQRKDWKVY